ncbi:hypothetical protein [Kaistella jeonii]|uniref:Uncharacterized protein n=1 Tax=Kaistella jeonii TaxID=266749 RepID=A0A0C1FDD7_9FLAO|nr:hypothetical protein [Kaistella jeonii]KIA85989.1 hypothetical protein OA86_14305 [Kaistella jeonii]SFC38015.1 hypothetical protein SAMN05421876_11715 [Kaistella jeonii]VEI96826.1 Uncharacterised protein [Kaistella jeonii]
MKNIIIALFISNFCFAQVGIEKTTVDGSGILDFPLGTTKGIILPNVTKSSDMTSVTRGTIVYDLTTKNAQYFDGMWRTLNVMTTGTAPTLLAGTDLATDIGVIIGKQSSSAQGVLILESDSKALILPKVNDPVANVNSPVAGMMCYDPVKKLMCIYNGIDWSFWR